MHMYVHVCMHVCIYINFNELKKGKTKACKGKFFLSLHKSHQNMVNEYINMGEILKSHAQDLKIVSLRHKG